MFKAEGINYSKDENIMDEVMLDGEDDLGAALSAKESGYPMYNIKVEHGFYTVYELKRKYDSETKKIILDSDFQRESVWKPVQKAELVESILMGLPLPIFYFNQDKLGRLIVVDGRQRLTALFEFMSNKWPLRGLKVLDELNGKKFDDLSPVVQSQIEDYQLQAHVIQPPTADRIKFDIFDRVNRAGTQLNKQEIRNALYQGKSTQLLNQIVETGEFAEATEHAFEKNARMKDKYLILRFLAFELYFHGEIKADNEKYVYKNDIDELLGLAMEHINMMMTADAAALFDMTMKSLRNSCTFFGENAFRMVRRDGTRSPVNMNIFEVLMHMASRLEETDLPRRKYIRKKVDEMKKSALFQDAIGNHRDSWQKVQVRYKMADEILEELHGKRVEN